MSTQRLLYDKMRSTTDIFTYQINSGGPCLVKETGIVQIKFINGKFNSACFPFKGSFTRNGWRILAAIEQEISAIEEKLKKEGELICI